MRVEFGKLEQRPGTHVVPVKMSREELERVADEMSGQTTRIEALEENLRSYSKELRDEIKELEEERAAANRVYRFKREDHLESGLWGFDFEDHGTVRCKVCVENIEKDENSGGIANVVAFVTVEEMIAAHTAADLDRFHAPNPIWLRPLGTKWFIVPESGDVFGPLNVKESDLQRELLPETKNVEPFALAFDSIDAIPLLDAKQVGEAEEKIKKDKRGGKVLDFDGARARAVEDGETPLCDHCGLALAWHDAAAPDPCKGAMVEGANRELVAQEKRTAAKYANDLALDPNSIYPCGKCGNSTFGKDLQPVTIEDGSNKMVCFGCEQGMSATPKAPEDAATKKAKAKNARKAKKGKTDEGSATGSK